MKKTYDILAMSVFFLAGCQCTSSRILRRAGKRDATQSLVQCVSEVMDTPTSSQCYPLLFNEGDVFEGLISEIDILRKEWGVGVFETEKEGGHYNNTTWFARLVAAARKLRKESWCVTVVVVSNDLTFLADFAEKSLKGRLFVWSTRLLVVTFLPLNTIWKLLTVHWTFSMANAMFIIYEKSSHGGKCNVYSHLPYTPGGAQVVRLASWGDRRGLSYHYPQKLFPEKFSNFHGATINVTALPYAPYWVTSGEGGDTSYSGIDYNQLFTLAEALNFNVYILPSRNWGEVTDQVEARVSFIASVVYVVLPNRLERWDFTHTFDYSPLCFAMAKPGLRPQWQNFHYPLSVPVWLLILGSTLAVCITLLSVTRTEMWRTQHGRLSGGSVVLETVGTLLGQGLFGRLSTRHSNHILIACWLFFGVVVGTAYRSSLIASLTIPKYPQRPETVQELVKIIERATIEAYGISYKNFFTKSEYAAFNALGRLMHVGIDIKDGLTDALTMKGSHLGSLQYLQLLIAQYFTRIDGTSSIYVGRESIIPAASAWPIPHDAPFKPQLDRTLMAITEAGLYEQWRKEMLEDAERESRMRQREQLRRKQEHEVEDDVNTEGSSRTVTALTFTHIQGPLIILLVGLFFSGASFLAEKLSSSLSFSSQKDDNLKQI